MSKKTSQGWVKHLDFIMLDLLCLHAAFLAAYMTRHGFLTNPYENEAYCSLLICVTLVELILVVAFNFFKGVLKRGIITELSVTMRMVLIVAGAAVGYLFALKISSSISRTVVFLMAGYYAVISFASRMAWKSFLRKRLSGVKNRSMLLIVTQDRAEAVVRQIKNRPLDAYRLAGIVLLDDEKRYAAEGGDCKTFAERVRAEESGMREVEGNDGGKPRTIGGIPVVAEPENAAEYACREWVDEVLFCADSLGGYPMELSRQFMEMGVIVHFCLPDAANPYGQKQYIGRLCGMNVVTSSIRWVDGATLMTKRLMDIFFGLAGTVITLLLTALVGPVIYFSSPGPIFFTQVRVGKGGKKFKMYKFRSMYPDAEQRKQELMSQNNMSDERMFKLDYDPRIIGCHERPDGTVKKGIGNFIRDWSLDEFPQFINVLLGDMSVVGTRPPTVDEWEKYELHHRRRLAVRPGITGLWQVSGRSNITDFEEVVKLDAEYIARWSIGMDLRIILKTLQVVVKREGAR